LSRICSSSRGDSTRRYLYPAVRTRTILLIAFALAEALLLTGTWQFAFLAGFVAGMFAPRGSRALVLGGLGVALAWSAYLAFVFVVAPGAALADLVGAVLGVGRGAGWLLTFLTLVLGFLLGAVGGLTGYTGSRLFLWEDTRAAAVSPKA
jgi:hypothetical protein